jgi:hypothetical protein
VLGADGAGSVHVLFSGGGSIEAGGNKLYTQNTSGVPDTAELPDAFGFAVAVGDLFGNATEELIVGSPFERTPAGELAGAYHIFPGGPLGPETSGVKYSPGNEVFGQRGVALAA